MAANTKNVRSSLRLKYRGARYSLRSRDVYSRSNDHLKRHKSSFARKISKSKETSISEIERRLLRNQDYKEQSLQFANAALYHWNYRHVRFLYLQRPPNCDLELVKPGLFEGAVISGGTIFHINFEARVKGERDYPLRTIFAQIRLIGDDEDHMTMFIDCSLILGLTPNLPEEVHDGGCQYCSILVYHPIGGCNKLLRGCVNDSVSWLHANTDTGYFRPSWYKYSKHLGHSSNTEIAIRTMVGDMLKPQNSRSGGRYLQAGKKSNSKSSLDAKEDSAFARYEDYRMQCFELAIAALSYLNAKEGVDYELVKPGISTAEGISRFVIFHANFKAKCKGDPDARVQTFFAQIRCTIPGDSKDYVDCCVNLGPTDELPEKIYKGGCQYCEASSVNHPKGGCEKLLLGCENDDDIWLYGNPEYNRTRLNPCEIHEGLKQMSRLRKRLV